MVGNDLIFFLIHYKITIAGFFDLPGACLELNKQTPVKIFKNGGLQNEYFSTNLIKKKNKRFA